MKILVCNVSKIETFFSRSFEPLECIHPTHYYLKLLPKIETVFWFIYSYQETIVGVVLQKFQNIGNSSTKNHLNNVFIACLQICRLLLHHGNYYKNLSRLRWKKSRISQICEKCFSPKSSKVEKILKTKIFVRKFFDLNWFRMVQNVFWNLYGIWFKNLDFGKILP